MTHGVPFDESTALFAVFLIVWGTAAWLLLQNLKKGPK